MSYQLLIRVKELEQRIAKLEAYVNEVHADALEGLNRAKELEQKKPGPKKNARTPA